MGTIKAQRDAVIQAKKRFGQNFLQDNYYLDKIIQAIPDTSREIVEIGPGLGDLTKKLLTKNKVVAIEIDEDLIEILESKFAQEIASKRLRLIRADAMQLWSEGLGVESSFAREYNYFCESFAAFVLRST